MTPAWARSASARYTAPALIVALCLAACGRYGPLEPPPEASAQATPQPAAAPPSEQATAGFAKPKNPPITPPNQPFFLDPLLK